MISIIVPTHHNSAGAKALLDSIAKGDNENINYEVIVVSNPGDPGLRDHCRAIKHVRYFETTDIGVNRARNIGILESKFPILLFFDDDCVVDDPSLLNRHLEFHSQNPKTFAYGGLYHISGSSGALRRVYHFLQISWLYDGVISPTQSKYLIGGHVSIKKSLLGSQNFDPVIKYGGSEHDFFLRMHQKNLQMVLGSLSVLHKSKISLSDFLYKAGKQGAGKAYIDGKKYREESAVYSFKERTFRNENLNSFGILERLLIKIYLWVFYYSYNKAKKDE